MKKSSHANFIPLSVPHLEGNEWKYIKECLDTGWVSLVGSYVERFEERMSQYIGSKYAVACASGTAALHIALVVSGIKENEEVIMPSLTFAAPAFATRYVGAWPLFMDVDPMYWQIDVSKLEEFLKTQCILNKGQLINNNTKRTIKAILPVHLLGHSSNMQPLRSLARKYKLIVIEDVAESIGAEYKGKKIGSFGNLGCFTLMAIK
ncbi:MAG: DegT/DnrJ/EryC1/StrS family aminotransferase [Candidatus Omnitrophica bacterium]|nr:DegT/DnrJ/EryC1/StrS family aminotransferase [Candidatus Omnitrophota bacterium]